MPNNTTNLLDDLPKEQFDKLRRRKSPWWMTPMLATLTDKRFSDEQWIFERKLDGERCLAMSDSEVVSLTSRNKKRLNATYPEIVDMLETQSCDRFLVDGEVVAFDGTVTSFSRLQGRMQINDADEARASSIAVYYYVFDLLYLDGYDTTQLALRDRKKLLRRALSFDDPLRFTVHRNTEGEAFYEQARRKGWEGIMGKRADSNYQQKRSRDWLKFKCVNQQEFVIGGYTDPQGERVGFGSLLIGCYDEDELVYAGKVGTGYDDQMLKELGQRLASKKQDMIPFTDNNLPRKRVHRVKPELVAEVGFTEGTDEGRLRHPRFLGLRRDKSPQQVHREAAS